MSCFAGSSSRLCSFVPGRTAGLDMAELLKELQIPVYYAPEHATTRFPPAETAALEHSDLGSEAWIMC